MPLQNPSPVSSSQPLRASFPDNAKGSLDDRSHVQQFLDDFARAFTAGDGNAVARLWETPALVMSDAGTHAVDSPQAAGDFFSGAKDQYNAQGVTGTRAEIQHVYWVTDRIVMVEVRWPHLDAEGSVVGAESSTYILRMDEQDQLKLRVAMMQGEQGPH